ncbi:MAG TPA: hypothetical protein DD490_25510 [Acidobacteria bacterium]|nr:hypothetical protein [Acidobacteriota bacterium]
MPFGTELKRALRARLRRPWAGLLIVLTLALGIGASAAMAGLADVALWRPLPFPQPDRLVVISAVREGLPADWRTASYPDFVDWQSRARGLDALAINRLWSPILRSGAEPVRVEGAEVSPELLDLLGVRPVRGRPLQAQDFRPGAASVVLLSDRLWREQLGGDPGLVGKAVSLDERSFTVVGILAPRAPLTEPLFFRPPDALVPLVVDPQGAGRGSRIYRVVARLGAGVPVSRARRELAAVAQALAAEHPKTNAGWSVEVALLREVLVGDIRPALRLLVGAGLLVLLLACANVANVLVTEAALRRRELALQAALGAGRRFLFQTLAAESLPLAALGWGLGLLVTWGCWHWVGGVLPGSIPGATHLVLDGRILALSLGLTGAAVLLVAGAPLLAGSRISFQELTGGVAAASPGRSQGARQLVLVGEIALATLLLISAALMTRSLLRLLAVDPGFRPERTWAFELELPFTRYAEPRPAQTLVRELLEGVRNLPGRFDAAVATRLPFQGGGMSTGVGTAEAQLQDWQIELKGVSPGYFATLGIPLLRGRDFTEQDLDGDRKVVVLNATAAERLWPGQDPIGRLVFIDWDLPAPREVIGLVADVRQETMRQPARPEVYLPFHQLPYWSLVLAVHTPRQAEVGGLATQVRRVAQRIDPEVPVLASAPVQELVDATLGSQRLQTRIVAVFTTLGVLLALAGVFGVTAALVERERRAIAVRIAVGALPRDVLRLILRRATLLVVAGLAAGLIGAALATRLLRSLLFEVRTLDGLSFVFTPLLLAGLALAAAALPAWRATRIDPAALLKEP